MFTPFLYIRKSNQYYQQYKSCARHKLRERVMEKCCIATPEELQKSLRTAVEDYWLSSENRKISGISHKELQEKLTNYNIPYTDKTAEQFKKLFKALSTGGEQPTLYGRFYAIENIDNGNATRTIDCEFTLLSSNYSVDEDGSIHITNLLTHKRI